MRTGSQDGHSFEERENRVDLCSLTLVKSVGLMEYTTMTDQCVTNVSVKELLK